MDVLVEILRRQMRLAAAAGKASNVYPANNPALFAPLSKHPLSIVNNDYEVGNIIGCDFDYFMETT